MAKLKHFKAWAQTKRLPRFLIEFFWPAIFALALPLQDYARQVVTLAYSRELILLLVIFGLVSLAVFSLFYFTIRLPFARLLATMLAIFLLMQNSDLRGSVSRFSDLITRNSVLMFPASVIFWCFIAAFISATLINRFWRHGAPKILTVLRVICLVTLTFNGAWLAWYIAVHLKTTNYSRQII